MGVPYQSKNSIHTIAKALTPQSGKKSAEYVRIQLAIGFLNLALEDMDRGGIREARNKVTAAKM